MLQKPCKTKPFNAKSKVFVVQENILHLPPVNQNSNHKMKKIITFVAVSAMVALTSCGGGEDEAARKADSTHDADSVAAAEKEAQRVSDSAHGADSIKGAIEQWRMDSAHDADSIAAIKPGKAPKPVDPPKPPAGKGKG